MQGGMENKIQDMGYLCLYAGRLNKKGSKVHKKSRQK